MGPLKNARELFKEILGQSRPKYPAVLAKLKAAGIEPMIMEGKNEGGGPTTHALLTPADYERFKAWMVAEKAAEEAKASSKKVKDSKPPLTPLPALNEELSKWKEGIESIITELMEKVDSFHKYLEGVNETYTKLRGEVDPATARKLPIPSLPPRYKWKVVVIGGFEDILSKLREQFPSLKIVGIQYPKAGKQAYPQADLALLMKKNCSHALQDQARNHYGRDKITIIEGGSSAAAAAISVWLHEQEKREEVK